MKDTVESIMITLEVGSKQSLFILLAADGSLNRLGTGSAENTDNDMFIGVTKKTLFKKLRKKIPQEWFDNLGRYEISEKKGLPCELTILMKHTDGQESGIQFLYGTESQGPPEDIVQFVSEAVKLTNPWHEAQKKMVVDESEKGKPRNTIKDCYCDLWDKNPDVLEKQGVPRGYCGLCQLCGKPGHTRHFPGAVPYTGTWCEWHYWRLMLFHPCSAIGYCVWLTALAIVGIIIWKFVL